MTDDAFSLLKKPIRLKLEKEQVAAPSEIQKLAIPTILNGKNTLIIAPTGTGKTYAAVLPVLDLFLSARGVEKSHGISILYVTPLRALNRDLLRRLSEMGKDLDIDIQVRHGDTPARTRTLQAKFPPDMLITTPETLQAILPGKKMRTHLKSVRWVIVDEIHELVTNKRGVQLSVALERLEELVGKPFQRIGLSATIGDVDSVANFLGGTARDVQVLKAADLKKLQVGIEFLTPSKADTQKASELGIPPATVARVKRICEMIKEHKSSLIFTNTREHAEALGVQIQAICGDIPVKVHHGSLSREIREEVEQSFQNGSTRSVVCTSSLELGIDIGSVDFIIQYMSPRQATRLIQRVGRSGHKVEAESKGCIVSAWTDDILESSVIVDHAGQEILEPARIHINALDVLAHQILGMTLDTRQATLEDVYRIIGRTYSYKDLQLEEFTATIQQLVNERILRIRDNRLQPIFPKAFSYYYENLSVIPDVKRYTVMDFVRKRRIGTLDQEFVARRCKSGTEFVMHGQTWKVIVVKEQDLTVEVEPTNPSLNAIPSWEGEIIPVDFLVATRVGQLRETLAATMETEFKAPHISEFALTKVLDTIRAQKSNYPIPTNKRIVVENFENCTIIHSCFGNLVNETLAIVLATLLTARLGANIATQTDAYRIGLISPFRIEPSVVAGELAKLSPDDLKSVLDQAIERTNLFAWRNWHVARRFGAVQKSADYKSSRGKLLADVYKDSPIARETRHEIYLEKLDLKNAMTVLAEIQNHKITIEVAEQRGEVCSPLALPMIDKIVPHEMLRPAVPTSALVDIIRERLESHTVRLVCIFNADWDAIRVVKTLSDKIKCPHCKSTLIAATYHTDEDLIGIFKKKKRGKTLSPNEKEHWDRAWKSASLVQVSGKKAIIAMSGRGVGPVTAARILRKSFRSYNEFYVEILKAEREYARTRLFWD